MGHLLKLCRKLTSNFHCQCCSEKNPVWQEKMMKRLCTWRMYLTMRLEKISPFSLGQRQQHSREYGLRFISPGLIWINFFFQMVCSFCIGNNGSSGGLSHTSLTAASDQPSVSVLIPAQGEACSLSPRAGSLNVPTAPDNLLAAVGILP